MEIPLSSRYTILERFSGHTPTLGKSAGEELNWAFRILDTENNEECIGMYCKPNHITLIDKDIWEELTTKYKSSISWYLGSQGYIARTVKETDDNPYLTLHQFVTKHIGQGKGKQSVDHINQNKLDNRLANLRIVGQGEQNANRGKVTRHKKAKELPKEITEPLPKFCVYYKECFNKEKGLWREFFTIEGHPKQEGKRKATSKSGKVNILDKLKEAKEILFELDNGHPSPPSQIPPITMPNISQKEPEVKEIQKKESLPTQWKVSNIYTYLTTGKEDLYKQYVIEANPEVKDIEELYTTLLTQVKGCASQEEAEPFIKAFVENLRTLRHNALCYKKNHAVIDREDREVWRADSVLHAFQQNKLEKFKEFTEEYVGDKPDDTSWCKRWEAFVSSVQGEEDETKQKALISKFLTAQRTKKYRRSEKKLT
jgi:hypothetical protein